MLDNLGVPYENERQFDYYSVDNYLRNSDLIIEVMGDYWHANPCKYKTSDLLNDTQIKRAGVDKSKHSYIKNQYGIEVLYLWETDIYDRPNVCESLIYLYIERKGKLKNYHSFNYSINSDGNLILNQQLIIPYQNQCLTNTTLVV